MEINHHRRRWVVSRLERLLARLVEPLPQPRLPEFQVDLVLNADVEFRQA